MLIDITDTVQLTHTAAEVDADIDGSVRGDIAQLKDDTWKAQARENIGAIGGSGGGDTEIVTDEFISKVSTYNYLAKIKKLTGKSVVQNNAIVDTDIKGFGSTGKNLVLPDKLEVGYYRDDGYHNDGDYRSSNSIPVVSGETYFSSLYNSDGTKVDSMVFTTFASPTDTNAIRQVSAPTLTIANGENYIRVRNLWADRELVKSGNGVIVVKQGAEAFEPYNPYYRNFPIVLRSAGNVADEVEDTGNGYKVTRRVGSVDLGSLSWTTPTYSGVLYCTSLNLATSIKKVNLAEVANVTIASFTPVTYASIGAGKKIAIGQDSSIWLTDSSQTAETFVGSLSGIYLNYELATPIVEYHDYNLTYPVTENGTEYFDSPISVPCEIEYGIDALNDIVKGVVGGDTERDYEPKLLWENASPSSAFIAQTIALDLSEYKAVYVDFGGFRNSNPNNTTMNRVYCIVGSWCEAYTHDYRMYTRTFRPLINGIEFRDNTLAATYGNSTRSVANDYQIPFRIYGIK